MGDNGLAFFILHFSSSKLPVATDMVLLLSEAKHLFLTGTETLRFAQA